MVQKQDAWTVEGRADWTLRKEGMRDVFELRLTELNVLDALPPRSARVRVTIEALPDERPPQGNN